MYSMAMVYYTMLALHPPYTDLPNGTEEMMAGNPPTVDPSWHNGFMAVRRAVDGSGVRSEAEVFIKLVGEGGLELLRVGRRDSIPSSHEQALAMNIAGEVSDSGGQGETIVEVGVVQGLRAGGGGLEFHPLLARASPHWRWNVVGEVYG